MTEVQRMPVMMNGGLANGLGKLTVDCVRNPSTDSGVSLETEMHTECSSPVDDRNVIISVESSSYSVSSSSSSEVTSSSHHFISSEVKSSTEVKRTSYTTSPKSSTVRRDPDEVMPAESYKSYQRDVPAKLRMAESGPLSEKPISIMTALRQIAEKHADRPALASKIDGQWQKITYKKYHELVQQAAKGFIKLGLEPYHGVGIIGFNSAEWFIADLAAVFACGFATGIYTTNTPEACQYVAESAECNIIVVENDYQLHKILAVWDQLPHLKAVIHYRECTIATGSRKVLSWNELMEIGCEVSDDELQNRISLQAPNKCCTLIYTSGTTGNPKGVMLSHDNLVWTAKMAVHDAKIREAVEELVSYLPLSHVAAQILDIYIPMMAAATVYFAQPDALKGSLGETLKEVRPTVFLGVPRVWEKMQEKMVAVARTQGGFTRRIAIWAKGVGLRGTYAMMNNGSVPYGWTVANALVFRKVRQALGFDRCRFCMTSAAPIMPITLEFFASLNIPILEIYGMSETSGPHTISVPWNFHLMSVGKEFSGATTMLANVDKDGNGEVCMSGRHVFMGYLNMKDKTDEALDDDGWLHSGDIGRKDDRGFLFITGRLKELLITAGGENVAPVLIEDAVKEALPCVSNCMLVGDARKYLSILLTLKVEVDRETTVPTTKLTRSAREWFAAAGSNITDVTELTSKTPDEKAVQAINAGIDAANRKAISRAQIIQKWIVLEQDFSIVGGELGPTLKLRRPIVNKMYEKLIESLYDSSEK